MSEPAQIDIVGDRHIPLVEHYSFVGEDFTGSSMLMHVRQFKDTAGTPLISHSTALGGLSILYAGTALVSAHVTAGRVTNRIYEITNPSTNALYQPSDSVALSQIGIGILAGFLEALPYGSERGDNFNGYYDIIRTPASGDTELLMAGKFSIRAGVTIP